MSLWQEGKEFQAGIELKAMLLITSVTRTGVVEEILSTFKTKHSDVPKWNQQISFQVDGSAHVDIVLKVLLIMADGSQEPWGMLRLPVSEILCRGSHQGWFFLSDKTGNPFRKSSRSSHQYYQVLVRIDVSDDLDSWQVITMATTLECISALMWRIVKRSNLKSNCCKQMRRSIT